MSEKIPFLQLFDLLRSDADLVAATGGWIVVSAQISRADGSATIRLEGADDAAPALLELVQDTISRAYGLGEVRLLADGPAPGADGPEKAAPAPKPDEQGDAFDRTRAMREVAMEKAPATSAAAHRVRSKVIYGRAPRGKLTPKPMSEVTLNLRSVTVEGDVFAISHRELDKRKAVVVSFDMTDYTGSIHIRKFMEEDEARPVIAAIRLGQHLVLRGCPSFDRYYGDMVIDPSMIMRTQAKERVDAAPTKRVELHMHTNMSAMDALTAVGAKTDPPVGKDKNIIVRAANWGHRAIAITDHGVAHSFPNVAQTIGKHGLPIKPIYGVEAYFINDVDDRIAVHGPQDQSVQDEIVCFDIETTGLNKRDDVIIEIGAVVLRNGEVTERFNTFAAPGRILDPTIVRLTGITDQMLDGAPTQEAALRSFLAFVNGRPLAAHNAEFDTGFIAETCRRFGIPYELTSVDTLVLAQNLLPELGKYKLDTVAEYLELPPFRHHRASDDAAVVAGLLTKFWPMLAERGARTLQQIDPSMVGLRGLGRAKRQPKHLIILAKNNDGLRNLYKLISLSYLEHFKRYPIMPKSLINANREGLIIGSACEAGEVYGMLVAGKEEDEIKRIAAWYDYLEIQPLCNNQFLIRRGDVEGEEDLRRFNRTIVRLGEELGKPVCATGDVHFLDPEDEIYRHILLAAKRFDDADEPLPIYFKTTNEMLREFSYLGEQTAYDVVVKNTNLVADWCDRIDPLPKGLFAPKLENSDVELKRLVWDKAHALYGDEPPKIVTDRIEAELGDIIRCKYDVIYMSAQKLVQNSLEHDYLVGSRGSVGSSLVAFMAGITEVNSLPAHYRCPNCKHCDFDYARDPEHPFGCGADMPDAVCPVCGTPYVKDGFNIPFETFLGFGGDKVPDIDLNFSGEYQASAHRHTFDLFGQDHVFRSGTISTVKDKIAYGYVKHYLEEHGLTVTKAEENRLALNCCGVKATTGQHPGGMVVIPQDKEIFDFCPAQHPADDPDSDIITTHFEYHSMESNLLKLDMLGHDDPTMIRMLKDLTGIDPQTIPLDDPDTMSIFRSSEKLGYENDPVLGPTGATAIPEFGTSFVRGMLEDTRPEQFDILIRLSGFSHGTDVWLGNAKDLIDSGTAKVSEAIGCRDDIMLYLISKGLPPKRSFKIMEAVRKGKGLPEGADLEMREAGVPSWYIDSCRKIAYLFPKAHAVAYVMMAFRIAWFKVHRPLAFYAAYFSIRAKAFDQQYMCRGIETVKRKMREIQLKDKEASAVEQKMLTTLEVCYEFYLRGFSFERIDLYRSDALRFLMDEERASLRPPFVSVAGLGETAAISLAEQRRDRKFISIEEVADACPKVSKTHIEMLSQAGAFGDLPRTSQIDLLSEV